MVEGLTDKKFLEKTFGDMNFPVTRDALIAKVRREKLGEPYIQLLLKIPDQKYSDIDELHGYMSGIGGESQPGI